MLEGLTRALPPGGTEEVTPGMALVALRTVVRRVFGISHTGGGGDKVYHWGPDPPGKGPGWAILAGERMVMTEDVGSIFRDGRTLQVSEA